MKSRRQPKRDGKKQFVNRPLEALAEISLQDLRNENPGELCREAEVQARQAVPEADEDDDDLFLEAVRDVRPLGERPSGRKKPQPRPPERSVDAREAEEVLDYLKKLVGQQVPFPFWCSDEIVEGVAAGVDTKILLKLRRGDFSIQAHLDLHGLTRDEAREEVARFIDTSLAMGRRCVLIIHGRGRGSKDKKPVLKESLCRWLTRSSLRKKVLAFTTARPCDGGAGAIYVLLRKSNKLVAT